MAKKKLPALAGQGMELVRGGVVSPFQKRSEVTTPANVIVKSMSPMLKPTAWPMDGNSPMVLVGKLTKFFACGEFKRKVKGGKTETIVGTGCEIVPEGSPVGVALAVTAILRTGLGVVGDGEKATSEFLGRVVEVELLGRVPSKKGQDAWNYVVAIHPAK